MRLFHVLSSHKTPEKTAFSSQKKASSSQKKNAKKGYPDWVYQQTKRPTLSNYSDSSDDDDDLKKAKLESLREVQQLTLLSEDEQIRRATIASLLEGTAGDNVEHSKMTALQEQSSDSSGSECPGTKAVLESKSRDSEDERVRLAKIASLEETSFNVDGQITPGKNEIHRGSQVKRRNSTNEDETKTHVEESKRVNETHFTVASQGSSSKRRKIEQTRSKTEDMEVGSFDSDENKQLKRALEISLRDHVSVSLLL